jgi:hypothetical protein
MSKCLAQEKHKQRAVRIQCRFRHLADLQDFVGSPNRSNTTAFMAADLHPQLLTMIIG